MLLHHTYHIVACIVLKCINKYNFDELSKQVLPPNAFEALVMVAFSIKLYFVYRENMVMLVNGEGIHVTLGTNLG